MLSQCSSCTDLAKKDNNKPNIADKRRCGGVGMWVGREGGGVEGGRRGTSEISFAGWKTTETYSQCFDSPSSR